MLRSLFYYVKAAFLCLYIFCSSLSGLTAQSTADPNAISASSGGFSSNLVIGFNAGYDQPLFNLPYDNLKQTGDRVFSAHIDYFLPGGLGFRASGMNINSNPQINLADEIQIPSLSGGLVLPVAKSTLKLNRNFAGLGLGYRKSLLNGRVKTSAFALGGKTWFEGGDALAYTTPPPSQLQILGTGFEKQAWTARGDLNVSVRVLSGLHLNAGVYYLHHFKAKFDGDLDLLPVNGPVPMTYYSTIHDNTGTTTIQTPDPAQIIGLDCCKDLISVGGHIGLSWEFGGPKAVKPPKAYEPLEAPCNNCCPDDKHKVLVTIIDQPTGKPIPGADALIIDRDGNVAATGTSNSFGVVDFGELIHNDYTVTGLVYGVETTTDEIADNEFVADAIIRKQIFYTDLRFILKGVTLNLTTDQIEPGVLVGLTNLQSGNVSQDNSNAEGAFNFRLDKESSYKVMGSKENRLSELEAVTTKGLTRSTTLFVELELGVENFDCGQNTVLDIKYEFDKDRLTPSSKFELDRLVRYMKDHSVSRIQLSSHTDSRGSANYNADLSQRRAQSAVDYIVSQGVSRNSIIARGFGESRLLNRCADGVACSETEHLRNRRTEAQLQCN